MSKPELHTLKVDIVDDEEPLGLALNRILSKFRVEVSDVG